MDRRRFLATAAVAAGGFSVTARGPSAIVAAAPAERTPPSAPRALDLLILGGTGFIGPHQVRAALDRGHSVTLFNRGRTNPGLFPGIETLIGDRDGDLEALRGRRWDCVIDNSGYEPAQVSRSAHLLRDAVGQYLFLSSLAAYSSRAIIDQDETGAIGQEGVPGEEWDGYGPLKAACELELAAILPGRHTVLRPSVVVGPGDTTDRFPYWIDRIHRGGEILAPGEPHDPVQWIDVRDLCEWTVRLLEAGTVGVFNTTGPIEPITTAELVHGIRAVTTTPTSFVWTSHQFLREQGVVPFSQLPLWHFPSGATAGFMRMSAARAQAAGLTYRPLATLAADTLEWWLREPTERRTPPLRAGLSPERERELLTTWRARPG